MSNDKKTKSENPAAPKALDQGARRLQYGFSVAVLILASLVILVVVNYIANKYNSRHDFTATREYSLSEQTKNFLNGLDKNIRVTTLYTDENQVLTRKVIDFLGEYTEQSDKVKYRQINPIRNPAEYDLFLQEILKEYDNEVNTFKTAFASAKTLFGKLSPFAEAQAEAITAKLPKLGKLDQNTSRMLQFLNQNFKALPDTLKKGVEQLDKVSSQSNADYENVTAAVRSILTQLNNDILKPAAAQIEIIVEDTELSGDAKEFFLELRAQYRSWAEQITPVIAELDQVSLEKYNKVRDQISQRETIVVQLDSGEGKNASSQNMVVIPLNDVFAAKQPRPSNGEQENNSNQLDFKGEEIITGAMLSVTQDHKPLVVFVQAGQGSPLNTSDYGYSSMAERLRTMNFEVQEWNPMGRPGPGGRPMPAGPMPTPKPGQKMVFVALPSLPMRGQPINPGDAQVAQAFMRHLQSGQPGLLFAKPSTSAIFGQTDNSLDFLKEWGITAEVGRVVLTSRTAPDGTEVTTPRMPITSWPKEHLISKALGGLTGNQFQAAVPLTLANPAPEGVKVWPIIKTETAAWAESNMTDNNPKKDESDTPGPLNTGAAAEKNGQRLVVIGHEIWGLNAIVQSVALTREGGLARRFPGNGELFVNSIYWLAGMDQLIAASPRTQEIRRVEDMTEGQHTAVLWFVLGIMPLSCLVAGGAVWFMRRA